MCSGFLRASLSYVICITSDKSSVCSLELTYESNVRYNCLDGSLVNHLDTLIVFMALNVQVFESNDLLGASILY